jgi:hypothetical protein
MKKQKIPGLISVLILTLITIVMWVSLDVIRAFQKTTPSNVPAEISQPIVPSLDQTSMSQIESRIFLDDSQIPSGITSSSQTPAASPTPVPTIEPTTEPISASGSGITQ